MTPTPDAGAALPPVELVAWDAAERTRLLAALAAPSGGLDEPSSLLADLRAYTDGLPRVPVARCPHTGALVEHSLDTLGLDGPYWPYAHPARPTEVLPPTFVLLKGAMRLASPVETLDELVRPGPPTPFVVPELLSRDGMIAVISQLRVGAHTAWPVTYLHPDGGRPGFDAWGRDRFTWTEDGERCWSQRLERPDERDADLARWITAGKLRWIAPGDARLNLRDDAACPYAKPGGSLEDQSVRFGDVT